MAERYVVDPYGDLLVMEYTPESAQQLYEAGGRFATQEDLDAHIYDNPVEAMSRGALSSISFGASDYIGELFGGPEYTEETKKLYEYNPKARVVGELGGLATGMLIGTGEFGIMTKIARATPAVRSSLVAERAALGIVKRIGIKSPGVAKAAQRVIASGIEGGLYGGGHTISEAALGNTELNAETLWAGTSHGAIGGALVGGAIAASGGVSRAITKRALRTIENRAAADLGLVGKKARTLEEKGRLTATKETIKEHINIKSPSPSGVLENLKTTEQKMGKRIGAIIKEADDINPKAMTQLALKTELKSVIDTLPATTRQEQKAIKYIKDEVDSLSFSGDVSHTDISTLKRKFQEQATSIYRKSGTSTPKQRAVLALNKKAREIEEQAIQKTMPQETAKEFMGIKSKLSSVKDAISAVEPKTMANQSSGFIESMGGMYGFIEGGFGGMFGGALVGKVLKKVAKDGAIPAYALTKEVKRMANIAGALETQAPILKRAERVIANLVSSTPRAMGAALTHSVSTKLSDDELAYRARIYKAAANSTRLVDNIAESTGDISEDLPEITKHYNNQTMTAIQTISDAAPKNPYPPSNPRHEKYKPSKRELADFNSTMSAVEDPMGVLENVADGKIDHVAVRTVRKVYPNLFGAIQYAMAEQIASLDEELPYRQRLVLSTTFDLPIEPTMGMISEIQGVLAPRQQQQQQGQGRLRKTSSKISEIEEEKSLV